MPLAQAQNIHATVVGSSLRGVFQRNFSDERVRRAVSSGRIKAVGRWFESGLCVGPFRKQHFYERVIEHVFLAMGGGGGNQAGGRCFPAFCSKGKTSTRRAFSSSEAAAPWGPEGFSSTQQTS